MVELLSVTVLQAMVVQEYLVAFRYGGNDARAGLPTDNQVVVMHV